MIMVILHDHYNDHYKLIEIEVFLKLYKRVG